LRQELTDLIADDRVAIVGPIRQEVLSGVRDPATFDRLRLRLRAFEDETLDTDDLETAARMNNRCRQAGISGSAVDLLLCAVAQRRKLPIFTTDADFTRYATVLPIALHHPARSRPTG
ncbi:MAG: PIN domain-containing protein, partial [Deltaproteobacteria bacterium]|nr:PIN domain-containing protein [Deltaproteobacteria bacterium]